MSPITFSFDSSLQILAAFLLVGVVAGLLYPLGFYGLLGRLIPQFLRALVEGGFQTWQLLYRRVPWGALPVVLLVVHTSLVCTGYAGLWLLLMGCLLLHYGVSACMAFIAVDHERAEVSRGYMVLHNPAHGQQIAHKLQQYGQQVGLPLLIVAFVVCLDGFTLLNQGLYRSFGRSWYLIGTFRHHAELPRTRQFVPVEDEVHYADFLAFTLLNLVSAFDLVDVLNSSHWTQLAYVHPTSWQARLLLTVFRMFVTVLLLRQLFAWARNQRRINELIADLWSPSDHLRERARAQLGELGVPAAQSLLRAIEQVDFLTPEQRAFLASVIKRTAPAVVQLYVKRLTHPVEHVRELAVASLGRLGAVEALQALSHLRHDPSERVRLALAESLSALFEKGVPAVRKQLALQPRGGPRRRSHFVPLLHGNKNVVMPEVDPVESSLHAIETLLRDDACPIRLMAVRAVGRFGPLAARCLPDLLSLSEDRDESVRGAVAQALALIREPQGSVLGGFRVLLRDDSPSVRKAALLAVNTFEDEAYPLLPELLPQLKEADIELRRLTLEGLSRIGRIGKRALGKLVVELKTEDPVERARAAETLGYLGVAASKGILALIEATGDASARVQGMAAWALGRMGPVATRAVPAIRRLVGSHEVGVAVRAIEALESLGGPEAIEGVCEGLTHPSPEARRRAAQALTGLGVSSEVATPALVSLVDDPDSRVRLEALQGLGNIAHSSQEVMQVLRRVLAATVPQERAAAVRFLGKLNLPTEKQTAEALPLLEDPSTEVRVEVAHLLGRHNPPSEEVIAALDRLVRADIEPVQVAAAQALGQLGKAAFAARDGLRLALERGSAAVRYWSLRGLARIEPDQDCRVFLAALHDVSPQIRRWASAVLVRRATQFPDIDLTHIVEGLHDADVRLRVNLAMVLGRRQVVPAGATGLLLDGTRHARDGLRLSCLRALRYAGATLTPELPRLLGDPNVRIALVAAEHLLREAPFHLEASARLRRALQAISRRDRWFAVRCLEQIGAAAESFGSAIESQAALEADLDLKDRLLRLILTPVGDPTVGSRSARSGIADADRS